MGEYELRYLPLFYEDLRDAAEYIAGTLMNPQAALNLIDQVEKAILDRSLCPEAFEPYKSKQNRKYPYYPIYI